ncbi:MAG TPA: hypothetical protein PLF96_08105 [Thermotogota bacterium]|nr:hypothetical protein [Thermotogota bacterium]
MLRNARGLFWIVLLSLSTVLAVSLPDSVQEITPIFQMKMSQETTLRSGEIGDFFAGIDPRRAFLTWNSAFPTEKSLLVLDAKGHFHCFSLPGLEERTPLPSETMRPVRLYLAFADSLFSPESFFSSLSYNTLLMQDLSYLNSFNDQAANLIQKYNDAFKNSVRRETFTTYLKTLHRMQVLFCRNFPLFLQDALVGSNDGFFELDDTTLAREFLAQVRPLFFSMRSALERDSFLQVIPVFTRVSQILELSSAATSSEYLFQELSHPPDLSSLGKTPFDQLFTRSAGTSHFSFAWEFAIWINLQYNVGQILAQRLTSLVKEVSATYGVFRVSSLEDYLSGVAFFQSLSLCILEKLEEGVAPENWGTFLEMYRYRESQQQLDPRSFELYTYKLGQEVNDLFAALSHDPGYVALSNFLSGTRTLSLSSVPLATPVVIEQESALLISELELEQPGGDFAWMETRLELATDESEVFRKVYPVFPAQVTGGLPLVLVDFLWFTARHPARTLAKTLSTVINSGLNLLELEKKFLVEQIEFRLLGWKKWETVAELWRMVPTRNAFFTLQFQNSDPETLLIQNLFGSKIPEFLTNEQMLSPPREYRQLFRVPVEVYTCQEKVQSNVPRSTQAIVFIHGKQEMPSFDTMGNIVPVSRYLWRNTGRMDVWNPWYRWMMSNGISDMDTYEFVYDTSSLPAEGFGQQLAQILQAHGFLEMYDTIFLVAHSMGGLVARGAANTPLTVDGQTRYLGEFLDHIVTIDTPHLGTLLQTIIQGVNPRLLDFLASTPAKPTDVQPSLYSLFRAFLNDEGIDKGADMLISLAQKNPEVIAKFFSEGYPMLDPFPGGQSMFYVAPEYIKALKQTLYGKLPEEWGAGLFFPSENLIQLNETDRFYGKTTMVSCELDGSESMTNSGYALLFGFMQKMAALVTTVSGKDFTRHERNDAVVPLFSQQLWGSDFGQQRLHFRNFDHTQIPMQPETIQTIFSVLAPEMREQPMEQ